MESRAGADAKRAARPSRAVFRTLFGSLVRERDCVLLIAVSEDGNSKVTIRRADWPRYVAHFS